VPHDRRFRFSAQVARAASAREWREIARKAEDLGYSALTVPVAVRTSS
jgi:alkanesulfonate monooxygenase SsuD/methylene tetrahydromethanopterin reductase-like flavin-dependent oxidoreductase (luciferase family)